MKTVDFRESSLIATVFSEEHGKIALIAKGAKKSKSKFMGMVQPGRLLSVIYYYKPTRAVQTLSEAAYEDRLDSLSREMPKMALTMGFLELVSQVIHEGEINDPVFQFAKRFLIWLNGQEEVTTTLFPYLQIRLADLLGLALQSVLDNHKGRCYFNISEGTLSAQPEAENAALLTDRQREFILEVLQSRKAAVLHHKLDQKELKSLIHHLDVYFRYHLEGVKPRSSDAIFDLIL